MSCIHDENGQVLVDEVEVIKRWKEHKKFYDVTGRGRNGDEMVDVVQYGMESRCGPE